MNDNRHAIDTSLVEHMLTLSYEERVDAHEAARQLMEDLLEAGQEYYARQPKNTTSKTLKT
jgi:hypothetical protein